MKQIFSQYKRFLIPTTIISSLILFFLLNNNKNESSLLLEPISEMEEPSQEEIQPSKIETQTSIYVDVKGAVHTPGVYELTINDRIIDAIQLAGGYTEQANTNAINHAQKVADEMVIYVPKIGEELNETSQSMAVITPSSETKNGDGKVNINTASLDELTNLPGIGPQKAQAILTYREENGHFQSIDELKNVSGIGDKTYEKLKDLIDI